MASLTWYAFNNDSQYATVTVYYTENIYSTHSTITVNDIKYYNSYTSATNAAGAPIYWTGLSLQITGSFGTHTVISSMHFPSDNCSNTNSMSATTPNIAAGSSAVSFVLSGTLSPNWDWGTLNRQPLTIGSSQGSSATTQSTGITYVPINHKLSISAGTGSSIVVKRTNSPLASASNGALSNGATIYEKDVLQVTFSPSTGYNIATHTVNGSAFTSGGSYTVPASLSNNTLSIVATATVKSYKLTISQGTGSTITVNRTSSPKQGASTGNLSNGSTIYYSDILKISLSANTGYNVGTLKVNSSTFTSGNSHTVTDNVAVSSTASVKSYKLSISAGTGSTITVNRTSSPKQGAGTGALSNGATIYYSDVLKITFASSPEYEILTHTVNSSAFTSGGSHTVTGAVAVATTTRILGIIYIDNGTTFEKYMVFIDNGTSWDQYIPYIDNGTGWDQYS